MVKKISGDKVTIMTMKGDFTGDIKDIKVLYQDNTNPSVNEALLPADTKVVKSFFDNKPLEGRNLNTDGKVLKTAGIGSQEMYIHTPKGVKMVGKITGKYAQSLVQFVNKNYKSDLVESMVNEAVSKTYKLPTQRGTLHIEVEEDPAGVFVDVIFNRVELTTTDIQFPTGEIKITQRQKRVKLKESVNEGKDDFVARHGKSNIILKKGYKHHNDTDLEKLYDKLGSLVKGLKVKDVTLAFESINEGRAFINAARKAKQEGKTEFEFNGKKYPVTIK
jgi:hypothetical protein